MGAFLVIRAIFLLLSLFALPAFGNIIHEYPDGRIIVNAGTGPMTLQPNAAEQYRRGMAVGQANYARSLGLGTPYGNASIAVDRYASARNLAKAAKPLARLMGPVGLGLTIADLIWDPLTQDYYTPGQNPNTVLPQNLGMYRTQNVNNANHCMKATSKCSATELDYHLRFIDNAAGWRRTLIQINPQGSSWVGVFHRTYNNQYTDTINMGLDRIQVCPAGTYPFNAQCHTPDPVLASDSALEDALDDAITAADNGHDIASTLDANGYPIEWGPIQTSGPASIQGPTTTQTTTGPEGITTRTTDRFLDFDYNGDRVTVSERETTTTQRPDDSTDTETVVRTPTPSDDLPPEVPGLCDLYPTISACQELGEPEEFELPEEQRDITWDQELSASGSCPAPYTINAQGFAFTYEWDAACQFASGIRPVVIGMAWLLAGIWLFGIARGRS